MSWGERSCIRTNCSWATMETCNVDCLLYQHDYKTEPDSTPADSHRLDLGVAEPPVEAVPLTRNQKKKRRKSAR